MLDRVLLAGTIAVSLAFAGAQLRRPVQDDLPVERIVGYYSALAPSIDAGLRVGFIGAGPDPTAAGLAHFLAQYALAPRVVDESLAAVTMAISAPGAPASLDGDPRLAGFELERVGEGGVRVYRRIR